MKFYILNLLCYFFYVRFIRIKVWKLGSILLRVIVVFSKCYNFFNIILNVNVVIDFYREFFFLFFSISLNVVVMNVDVFYLFFICFF